MPVSLTFKSMDASDSGGSYGDTIKIHSNMLFAASGHNYGVNGTGM